MERMDGNVWDSSSLPCSQRHFDALIWVTDGRHAAADRLDQTLPQKTAKRTRQWSYTLNSRDTKHS
jgi:hypothetical protein